ncbi:MAG: UPF0146 family protein [Nitrospirota bacterium]
METYRRVEGLVDYIAGRYDAVAEIGIGHFPDVALSLLRRGLKIFATDIKPFRYKGLKVIVDDIVEPDCSLYINLELLYSMRTPPELVPYMIKLAKAISADLIVKPLSSEYLNGKRVCYENSNFFLWSQHELCAQRMMKIPFINQQISPNPSLLKRGISGSITRKRK